MNPIKQLFGQTAVYGFGTVVPRLLNYLLLTPFFTRVFNLGEYGVVTELYAYVVFLMILLTYGMETGYFRYAQLYRNSTDVFSTSIVSLMVTSGGFILLISLCSESLAAWLGYGGHPEYIRWIGWMVGIDAFTAIPFVRLRWENKAAKFATIRIASVLLNVSLNFAFLYFIPELYRKGIPPDWIDRLYNPEIRVGYVFISNLAASIFTLLLLTGTIFRMKMKFNAELLVKMLSYSFPLLIAGVAGTINETLDRVLLKHLLPDHSTALQQLGVYGANYKIAVLMTLFVQMFRYAGEPFFFSKADSPDARELFAAVMKYFILAGLVIFLGVMLYLDLFKHFIGIAFRGGLNIVPIILLGNFLLGIFFNLSIWYKLNNMTRYGAFITLMGSAITFLLNWIFIPLYGYMASAWAHVACYGSMVIVSYIIGQKYYRIPYPVKSIGLYVMMALTIFVVASFAGNAALAVRLSINTLLLAGFSFVVYIMERKKIRKLSY